MILRVGLTGGISSGKSTILRTLAALGCKTIDADTLVAELYRPGNRGHRALVLVYGEAVLLPDRQIDRRKLAAIAFSSDAEAHRLNALIHPMVLEDATRHAAALEQDSTTDHIVVMEATLLLEAAGRDDFDRIVVVDVPEAVQVERAVARGMLRDEVLRRIAHQMARQERLQHADYVIENAGSEADGRRETLRVYQALRSDLEQKKQVARQR